MSFALTDLDTEDVILTSLSESLKKMQAEYLINATKKCYNQSKREEYTRWEQITVCKEIERERVWGRFDKMYSEVKDRSKLNF